MTKEMEGAPRAGDRKAAYNSSITQPHRRQLVIERVTSLGEIALIGSVDVKTWPGVLATAGDGLVFYADPNGTFAAADERQGKTLWHFPTRRNAATPR